MHAYMHVCLDLWMYGLVPFDSYPSTLNYSYTCFSGIFECGIFMQMARKMEKLKRRANEILENDGLGGVYLFENLLFNCYKYAYT
jgi:hypothetical protein